MNALKKYPAPWHFDGHGVNDSNGERILKAQVSGPYADDNKRLAEYDEISTLAAAAPEMLEVMRTLAGAVNLSKLNIRKDFHLINAHACALKIIHNLETGE
jgi:hypothetical protein